MYIHVVRQETPIKLSHIKAPAVTGVSRQVRAEALPIFFAENAFSVEVATNVTHFQQTESPEDHLYWAGFTSDYRDYLYRYNSARKSGLLGTPENPRQKWLRKAASEAMAFRNIKFNIVEIWTEFEPHVDAKISVRMTHGRAVVKTRKSDVVCDELLKRAQTVIVTISERPYFQGLTLDDLWAVARVFKFPPATFRQEGRPTSGSKQST